jgi:hypothetical protein
MSGAPAHADKCPNAGQPGHLSALSGAGDICPCEKSCGQMSAVSGTQGHAALSLAHRSPGQIDRRFSCLSRNLWRCSGPRHLSCRTRAAFAEPGGIRQLNPRPRASPTVPGGGDRLAKAEPVPGEERLPLAGRSVGKVPLPVQSTGTAELLVLRKGRGRAEGQNLQHEQAGQGQAVGPAAAFGCRKQGGASFLASTTTALSASIFGVYT